jgi:hypothetical protein
MISGSMSIHVDHVTALHTAMLKYVTTHTTLQPMQYFGISLVMLHKSLVDTIPSCGPLTA